MIDSQMTPYAVSGLEPCLNSHPPSLFWWYYLGLHFLIVLATGIGVHVGHDHIDEYPELIVHLIAPLQIAGLTVGPAVVASCALLCCSLSRKRPRLTIATTDIVLSAFHLFLALPTVR